VFSSSQQNQSALAYKRNIQVFCYIYKTSDLFFINMHHYFFILFLLLFLQSCTSLEGVVSEVVDPDKKYHIKEDSTVYFRTNTKYDHNSNGVPDFADFESTDEFTAIVFKLPADKRPEKVAVRFVYESSDPAQIVKVVEGDEVRYIPQGGLIRHWTVDGIQDRIPKEISQGGHFIESGKAYPLNALQTNNENEYIYYMEVIDNRDTSVSSVELLDIEEPADIRKLNSPNGEKVPSHEGTIKQRQQWPEFKSNQYYLNRQFYNFVTAGDYKGVEAALINGANPNYKIEGAPAINIAITMNRLDIVKLLLKHQANININGKYSNILNSSLSPLSTALQEKNKQIVEYLLSQNELLFRDYDTGNYAALLLAIKQGDLKLVKTLVNMGYNLDSGRPREGRNESILHYTIKNKEYEIAEYLLSKGLSANKYNPLLFASYYKDSRFAEVLLNYGADVNFVSKSGETALSVAVNQRNSDVAKLLLMHGAQPNFLTKNNTSFLDAAVRYNKYKMVKYLLASGADPNSERKYSNRTPLFYAISGRHSKKDIRILEELILYGADVSHADNRGETPLKIAEKNDHVSFNLMLKSVIDDELNIENTPRILEMVCKTRQVERVLEILQFLTQNNVQIDRDILGLNLIHLLNSHYTVNSKVDFIAAITMFIDMGVSPYKKYGSDKYVIESVIQTNIYSLVISLDTKKQYQSQYEEIKSIEANNELYAAIKDNNYDKFKDILDDGLAANNEYLIRRSYGTERGFLLFLAAINSDSRYLKLLLLHGGDPFLTDTRRKQDLLAYTQRMQIQVNIKIIQDARTESIFVSELQRNNKNGNKKQKTIFDDNIDLILENDVIAVAISLAEMQSPTVRTVMTAKRGIEYVGDFIVTHVDPEYFLNDRNLPLIAVSRYGSPDNIKYLVNDGLDVNAQDENGVTAIMAAAEFGRYKSVQYLIGAGASITIKDNKGMTALEYAKYMKHSNIIQLLKSTASIAKSM